MSTGEMPSYPRAEGRRKLTITLDDLEPEIQGPVAPSHPAAPRSDSPPPVYPPPSVALRPAQPQPAYSPPAPPAGDYDTQVFHPPTPPHMAFDRGGRAGFWKRFWALFIDGLILAIPNVILLLALGIVGWLLAFPLALAYFTLFEGSERGQTPGKSALDIRVISLSTGQSLGHGAAFGRQFGRILSGVPLDLGYLWMLWDPERQTWHDKLAGSVVVPVAEHPIRR